jgi:DNA (cytosine-5)-methyltransferase 1
LEICAGAGGQAIGIEHAGFSHAGLVEIDSDACRTLAMNRSAWNVINQDLLEFDAKPFGGVDLLAGGVPCPPFSRAGLKLGAGDERDLFPTALRIAAECQPKAIMLENVKGLLTPAFGDYRAAIDVRLRCMGYEPMWRLVQASDYGVPQLRPRVVCVALKSEFAGAFRWPSPCPDSAPTVGEALYSEMASAGWDGAREWALQANKIAPTIVGGSKKHGGPDLGPTQARLAWAKLGVNAGTVAEAPPPPGFEGPPRLTVKMAATIQGFPPEWNFYGRKTTAYRQVGNAFPPPVALAVAGAIRDALFGCPAAQPVAGQGQLLEQPVQYDAAGVT